MMTIDDAVMENLLVLSKLSLCPDEKERLKGQLEEILSYFRVLEAYDTGDVNVDHGETVTLSTLREDHTRPGISHSQIDQFAVRFENGFFVVPRILGDTGDV
jgi:aspartyl-tRNA(Asn)/glutamyl-tRNA(Gln) amidotransferase subunit C